MELNEQNNDKINILIVEDDSVIAESIAERFKSENWDTVIVNDGADVCLTFTDYKFDLVILDIMLPNVDGFTLIRQIRRVSDIPIIVLTAINSSNDEINAFELGADDYINKPLRPSLLVAHVNRWLERYKTIKNKVETLEIDQNNGRVDEQVEDSESSSVLYIDDKGRNVYKLINGKKQYVDVTRQEYLMLVYFMMNANKVLSREDIVSNAWGWREKGDTRIIDAFIKLIRKKIGKEYIKTIHGMGYKFIPNP